MNSKFESVTITPECFNGTTAGKGAVVFNPTEVSGAVARLGGSALLRSVSVHDLNDNSVAISILVSRKNVNDLGTLGAAIDVTDSEAVENDIIGAFTIPNPASLTAFDLTNSTISVGTPNIIVSSAEGNSSIFIAGIASAIGFVSTVDGLRITLGFERL
jgi:hypothetical protein